MKEFIQHVGMRASNIRHRLEPGEKKELYRRLSNACNNAMNWYLWKKDTEVFLRIASGYEKKGKPREARLMRAFYQRAMRVKQ